MCTKEQHNNSLYQRSSSVSLYKSAGAGDGSSECSRQYLSEQSSVKIACESRHQVQDKIPSNFPASLSTAENVLLDEFNNKNKKV
jgi:hypothetical protein